jgi:hypothetical protein
MVQQIDGEARRRPGDHAGNRVQPVRGDESEE